MKHDKNLKNKPSKVQNLPSARMEKDTTLKKIPAKFPEGPIEDLEDNLFLVRGSSSVSRSPKKKCVCSLFYLFGHNGQRTEVQSSFRIKISHVAEEEKITTNDDSDHANPPLEVVDTP